MKVVLSFLKAKFIFSIFTRNAGGSKNTFKSWKVLVTQGMQTTVQASWCYVLNHLRGEEGAKNPKS